MEAQPRLPTLWGSERSGSGSDIGSPITKRPSGPVGSGRKGDAVAGPITSNEKEGLDEAAWALHHAMERGDPGQLKEAIVHASSFVSPLSIKIPIAHSCRLSKTGGIPKAINKGHHLPGASPSSSSKSLIVIGAGGQHEAQHSLEAALKDARCDLRECHTNLAKEVGGALHSEDMVAVAGKLYDARRAGLGPGLIKLLEQRLAFMHEFGETSPSFAPPLTPTHSNASSPRAPVKLARRQVFSQPLPIITPKHAKHTATVGSGSPGALDPLEQQLVKEVFDRYDRDKSGDVDLTELQSLLSDLGAEMKFEDLEVAMQELDSNRNGLCSFKEFLAWWSAKVENRSLKDNVALAYMKTKLATEIALRKTRAQLARADMKDAAEGEMSINASLDLSSSIEGCPDGMTVVARLEHMESNPGLEVDALKAMLRTKSKAASVKVVEKMQELVNLFGLADLVTVVPDDDKVSVTLKLSGDMVQAFSESEESQVAFENLQKAFTKCELQVSSGSCFESVVSSPTSGTFANIAGARLKANSVLNQGFLATIADDEVLGSIIGCISGLDCDVHFGYDKEHVQEAVDELGGQSRGFLGKQFADLIPKSLLEQREAFVDFVYDKFADQGDIVGQVSHVLQYLHGHVMCIDSLTFTGLPGHSVFLNLSCHKFNPFAVADFMVQPLLGSAARPQEPKPTDDICRSLSDSELAKLRAAFETYDQDGSGAIDLNELQRMCKDLGGKLNDKEAREAMRQLDRNGTGKCEFENFVTFWSSKPGLGGYSSIALKFMKLKLAAGGFFGKSMNVLANSARRSVKALLELRPGPHAVNPKLSVTCSLQTTAMNSPTAEGERLKVTFKLVSNSEDQAAQVVSDIQGLVSEYEELFVPFTISVEQDSANIGLVLSAPAELLECAVGDSELAPVISPLLQLLTSLRITCSCGSTIEEWTNSPGTPLNQLLGGIQLNFSSQVSPALEMAKGMLSSHQLAMKLFAGCDVSCRLRYDEAKMASLLHKLGTPGAAEAGITVEDLKLLVASALGEGGDFAAKIPVVRRLADGLKALESIALEGSLVSHGGSRPKVRAIAKFDKFNPFCLVGYLIQPPVA